MAIWSTKEINNLLAKYEQTGTMPRNNPFYLGDTYYRKPDLTFNYTDEETFQLSKCMENIIYFGENYAKVMTDEGIRLVNLRPYQKKILLQYKHFRFNVYLASRQTGKCVTFDTEIENDGVKTPIFKLHYSLIVNPSFLTKMEYRLMKIMYSIKLYVIKKGDNDLIHLFN